MNDTERKNLAIKVVGQRERKFGTKKAAYQRAEVNAATWDKAEAGQSVRGDLLRKIVRTLWPETEGDWTLVGDANVTAVVAVEASGYVSDGDVLRAIAEVREDIRRMSEQIAKLEELVGIDHAAGHDAHPARSR